MLNKFLLLIIFTFNVHIHLNAQESYQIHFKNELNDYVNELIETNNGKIIAVGKQNILDYYKYSSKGKIWQFSSTFDTLSKVFQFGDTASLFINIEKSENNSFFIFGSMFIPPLFDKTSVLALKVNESLEVLNQKVISIDGWDNIEFWYEKKFFNSYYLFGRVSKGEVYKACIIQLNNNLEMVKHKIYDDFQASPLTFYWDCLLTPDSSQFLTLTHGFYNSSNLVVYDTALNYIYHKPFPFHWDPGTMDIDVSYGGDMTADWLSDSTFLVGCLNKRVFNNQTDDDDALGFSEMDTSMSIVPITFIGSIDTTEYPAWRTTFDFTTSDSIYFTGTSNMGFGPWPNKPSWIMAGMLDRNLNQKFIQYYGGDAYYEAVSMKCTSDGGMVIAARRYDYPAQSSENDAVFLKLNSTGLITGSKEQQTCPNTVFSVFPNPTANYINVTLVVPKADLRMYDISGVQLLYRQIVKGENLINIPCFSTGMYIIEIKTPQGEIFTKKIIKK
ncbi:MAG: T9SS type A sorting domain-containing protein [Bacteroidota bacterium]